jgi:hypothetical protein
MPVTFVIANPTDPQAFESPIQGPAWWLRGMSKGKDLTVIVPELTFTTPQMFGQASSTEHMDSAGISTDPRMIFEGAKIYGMTPKGGTPMIQVQQHGKRTAADAAGTITKASEDRTHVSHVFETSSGRLHHEARSDGLQRRHPARRLRRERHDRGGDQEGTVAAGATPSFFAAA